MDRRSASDDRCDYTRAVRRNGIEECLAAGHMTHALDFDRARCIDSGIRSATLERAHAESVA